MKIRDGHARLNGDKTEYEMPSGSLDIIADDGRTLFGISLEKDGSIRVDSGSHCKHGGIGFEDTIQIIPRATNVVTVSRPKIKLTAPAQGLDEGSLPKP